MIYYTGFANQTRQTAGAKAPSDILSLCEKRKYNFIPLSAPDEKMPKKILQAWKYMHSVQFWKKIIKMLEADDVLILQYPMYCFRILPKYIERIHKKGIKLIVLIHDLESLRKGIAGAVEINKTAVEHLEIDFLPKCDAVICHNEKMKQHMISVGYQAEKIVCLGIFDYLSDADIEMRSEKNNTPSIAVAGNLIKTKSGYIYHIHDNGHNPNLEVNLFGLSFDETCTNDNMIYHGSFPAAELPGKLKGDFGLVWDGLSAETCAGNTGEYLKYNNPHKTSLYLSSNLPVVVWSKAAIADFVLENKVGIAVDSLYELEKAINAVTSEEYTQMCENTKVIAEKLRSGYYFYSALDNGLAITGNR